VTQISRLSALYLTGKKAEDFKPPKHCSFDIKVSWMVAWAGNLFCGGKRKTKPLSSSTCCTPSQSIFSYQPPITATTPWIMNFFGLGEINLPRNATGRGFQRERKQQNKYLVCGVSWKFYYAFGTKLHIFVRGPCPV